MPERLPGSCGARKVGPLTGRAVPASPTMHDRDRVRRRAVGRDGHRALTRYVMLTASLLLVACVHEKGESQLPWLQAGLDSEFPDRGGAAPVDLSGAPQVTESHAAPVTPPAPSPPAVAPPAVVAEPPPAVVLAEPFVPGQIEDPNSGGSRPVIRVVGSGKPRAQGRRPDDRIEMTLPDEHASVEGASARPAAAAFTNVAESGAKQEYERGVALLNARDYDRALEAFGTYLVKWPDNARAEGAMYWSGECYLAMGEPAEAADEFEAALVRFPQGSKVPDGLLRLGVCAQRLGDQERAKAYFARLTREFPKSDAARRIPR